MGVNPSDNKGDNLPLENVSWDDATEFIRLLNAQSGGVAYRLPTEAEWEYAARAGTIGPYAGDVDAMAWYDTNSGNATHPVGQKQPNVWGLYDMHGNVMEWIKDWYGDYHAVAQTDPQGPTSGSHRVIRGGGFRNIATALRSMYRSKAMQDLRWLNLGFRLAMTADPHAANAALEKPVAPVVAQPNAGTPWRSPQGVDFVYVPTGSFDMGSNDGDPDEKPQHRVTISQGFYLGKTEVTQAQWKAVMGVYPSKFKGDNLPVENVSWDDVTDFIGKLNTQNRGVVYRLPTEAEWEYACRAGTKEPIAGELEAMAWFGEGDGGTTHPVGQKQPNAWGLSDIYGNVGEWVQDWYGSYRGEAQTDPNGTSSGPGRVLRGSSFNSPTSRLRSTLRGFNTPDSHFSHYGFRLAMTP